jgi:hypothetical protein
MGPESGSESGQEGSKESRSVVSWRKRSALETPSAIFQTVFSTTFVNKGKKRKANMGCRNSVPLMKKGVSNARKVCSPWVRCGSYNRRASDPEVYSVPF